MKRRSAAAVRLWKAERHECRSPGSAAVRIQMGTFDAGSGTRRSLDSTYVIPANATAKRRATISRQASVLIRPSTRIVAASGITGPPGSRKTTRSSPIFRRCSTTSSYCRLEIDQQQCAGERGQRVEVSLDGQRGGRGGVHHDCDRSRAEPPVHGGQLPGEPAGRGHGEEGPRRGEEIGAQSKAWKAAAPLKAAHLPLGVRTPVSGWADPDRGGTTDGGMETTMTGDRRARPTATAGWAAA
jgi:hypothetical protein